VTISELSVGAFDNNRVQEVQDVRSEVALRLLGEVVVDGILRIRDDLLEDRPKAGAIPFLR
jgi:hypothetical protein